MRVSCVQAVAGGGSRPVKTIGGSGFQSEEFGRLSQTASAAIESQVLVPIKRWLDVFNALSARMKEVEALRLEVDSRRHTVIDLAASVDKQRARLGKVGGHDAKLESQMDDTIKKLQHKESKLSLSVQVCFIMAVVVRMLLGGTLEEWAQSDTDGR